MDPVWTIAIVAALALGAAIAWGLIVSVALSRVRVLRATEAASAALARQSQRAQLDASQERIRELERALHRATVKIRELEAGRDRMSADAEAERSLQSKRYRVLQIRTQELEARVAALARWDANIDAEAELRKMRAEAVRIIEIASSDARIIIAGSEHRSAKTLEDSRSVAEAMRSQAEAALADASARAEAVVRERSAEIDVELEQARVAGREARAHCSKIIGDAESKAKAIAGEAWDVRDKVQQLREAAEAIQNTIDGYGTRYLIPAYSLMDEMASELAGSDPSVRFRAARDGSRAMVEGGQAAACEYSDPARREVAIRFLLDAFNGKADSILSRARKEDFGTLRQRLVDAFGLVNLHGEAFRGARIRREYLDARLEELKWACVLQELRSQAKEEQRLMRERMREEAAARREQERLQREAEEAQRRGLEIEEQLRQQREEFEREKATLTEEAQEKYLGEVSALQAELESARQAAVRKQSLAQQTRAGHVYVIANVGAFGEGVFKIGMTRRGDEHWRDRVDELSDASVPFDFNIHAVIKSDDAPALERRLHWHFALWQVNKKNHRKEFFRVSADQLRTELARLGIEAQWSLASELSPADFVETQEIERRIESDALERAAWMRLQRRRFGDHAAEVPAWASQDSDSLLADADG